MKNNKGAPKKEESLKVKYRIALNFNSEEYKVVNQKNLFKTNVLKDIILQSILNESIIVQTNKDPNYIKELNKIGINLNQIAKKANSINELSANDVEKINNFLDVMLAKITTD